MENISHHLDECTSAAPGISPGIVENSESLLRILFNPDHIRDGKIVESAIPVKDLRIRGFSVLRKKHVTHGFISSSIQDMLSRPRKSEPKIFEKVAKFEVIAVRAIKFENQQVFKVIDTALKNNLGHASIYIAAAEKGEGFARKMRMRLLPLFENRMSVDELFKP